MDRETVVEHPVVLLGPDHLPGDHVGQFHGRPKALAGSPHRPLEDVADAHLAARVFGRDLGIAIPGNRVRRDQEQAGRLDQRGLDVEPQAVGQIVLRGVAAQIGEGHDRDRGPVRKRQRLAGGGEIGVRETGFGAADAEGADRLRDILEPLLPEVLEAEIEAVLHVTEDAAGNADGAWLRERLQSRRHVHAVAKDVGAVHDDLVEVDAHTELDPSVAGHLAVALAHASLNRDGAVDRRDHAQEFDQRAIAARAHEAAAMLGDLGVDEFLTMGLERNKRSRFILPHEAAVADHVQREDCSEAAFHDGTLSSARAFHSDETLYAADLSHKGRS